MKHRKGTSTNCIGSKNVHQLYILRNSAEKQCDEEEHGVEISGHFCEAIK